MPIWMLMSFDCSSDIRAGQNQRRRRRRRAFSSSFIRDRLLSIPYYSIYPFRHTYIGFFHSFIYLFLSHKIPFDILFCPRDRAADSRSYSGLFRFYAASVPVYTSSPFSTSLPRFFEMRTYIGCTRKHTYAYIIYYFYKNEPFPFAMSCTRMQV